jgi:hypothetical protein
MYPATLEPAVQTRLECLIGDLVQIASEPGMVDGRRVLEYGDDGASVNETMPPKRSQFSYRVPLRFTMKDRPSSSARMIRPLSMQSPHWEICSVT